jgi:hypothetical protein
MKYIIVAFGDFQINPKLIKTLSESIAIISEKKFVKYSYGDNTAVINFYSEIGQEEVAIYVDELLSDVTTLFFLTPYINNVYTSLPMNVHKHLFGMSEIIDDDNYNLEDELDIYQLTSQPNPKTPTKKTKLRKKELSLDDVLDKINSQGIDSLTKQEKQILKTHSKSI